MDLLEFQARDLFAKHGVAVLDVGVAETPAEAKNVAQGLGDADLDLVELVDTMDGRARRAAELAAEMGA